MLGVGPTCGVLGSFIRSTMSSKESDEETVNQPFLDTTDAEIALFRAIARARPVGMNRHFNMLAILQMIKHETGRTVSAEDVWEKMRGLYDLNALEELVRFNLLLRVSLSLTRTRRIGTRGFG